jgi:hypothetical protein
MARALTLLLAVSVLVVAQAGARAPAPLPNPRGGPAALPVGKWKVAFANGVNQTCEVRKDGTASVVEPLRASSGKAAVRDGAAVLTFDDDRVEWWSRVGQRFVVEHWFPGSQFPAGAPVLGIAERVR